MSGDKRQELSQLPEKRWVLKALFGPLFLEIGEDLKKAYIAARQKHIDAAYKKLRNPNDGKKANLRIVGEVFRSGAFADDEICAEYFGGVLAASRSEDGKDDRNIQFVTTIKSMSSSQLRLHYFIYTRLNQLLCESGQCINVGLSTEIQAKKVYFSTVELQALGVHPETDFNVLYQYGLVTSYTNNHHLSRGKTWSLLYSVTHPTTYGVFLFAVAHNSLSEWRVFDRKRFDTFEGIKLPQYFASTLEELEARVFPANGENTKTSRR